MGSNLQRCTIIGVLISSSKTFLWLDFYHCSEQSQRKKSRYFTCCCSGVVPHHHYLQLLLMVLFTKYVQISMETVPRELMVVMAEAIWSMLIQKILQMFSFFLIELFGLLVLFLKLGKVGCDEGFLLSLDFFLSEFSR